MLPLTQSLLVLGRAEQFAIRLAVDLAEWHRLQFTARMNVPSRDEPWLAYDLAELTADYLEALRKLRMRLLDARWARDAKARRLRRGESLVEQVETQIAIFTDDLARRINRRLEYRRQRAAGIRRYVWVTEGDERVRPDHAANHGEVFEWDNPPATGHPGEAYNCRCVALPYELLNDPPIEPVYPELLILGGFARAVLQGVLRELSKRRIQQPKPQEKPQSKPDLNDPIFKRPKGVPKDWKKLPSRKKDGVRYQDPENPHNEVRIQKGNPDSQHPNSRKPYVRWKKDGKWRDKDGNISTDPARTHIPREDFEFDESIFR